MMRITTVAPPRESFRVVKQATILLAQMRSDYPEELQGRRGFYLSFPGNPKPLCIGLPKKEKRTKYYTLVKAKAVWLRANPTRQGSKESEGTVPGGAIRLAAGVISISGLTERLDTVASIVLGGMAFGLHFGEAVLILERCEPGSFRLLRRSWDRAGNR